MQEEDGDYDDGYGYEDQPPPIQRVPTSYRPISKPITPRKRRAPAPLSRVPVQEEEDPRVRGAPVRAPKRNARVQPHTPRGRGAPSRDGDIDRLRTIQNWAAATIERISGGVPKRPRTRGPVAEQEEEEVYDYERGPDRPPRKPLARGRGRGKPAVHV